MFINTMFIKKARLKKSKINMADEIFSLYNATENVSLAYTWSICSFLTLHCDQR